LPSAAPRCAELQRAELSDRLHAEVVAGTAAVMNRDGGAWNVTLPASTRRRISSSRPSYQTWRLLLASKLALAVEVDVDVQPLPHHAAGADRHTADWG